MCLTQVETCWQRYLLLPRGLPLVDLHRSLSGAGWDRQGRPRLATHAG